MSLTFKCRDLTVKMTENTGFESKAIKVLECEIGDLIKAIRKTHEIISRINRRSSPPTTQAD